MGLIPPFLIHPIIFENLQGACYSKSVCNGLDLDWQQSHLSTQHNPLASALVGAIVCGDAVATVSEEQGKLDELLNRLRRRPNTYDDVIETEERNKVSIIGNEDGRTGSFESPPSWADLPGELLAKIVRAGGLSPAMTRTMSQVCTSWRTSMASYKELFQTLKFNNLRLRPRAGPLAAIAIPPLPWVALQAITANNIAASVLAARFYQNRGLDSDAKKHWMRSARLGHPEALWRIGAAYYHGNMTLQQDSEEALHWLTRATKALLIPGQVVILRNTTTEGNVLMSDTLARIVLKECAHILGVIHLDGDATKQDTQIAIKWFQISHQHGCMEAGRMLQSLFRSGQY